MGIHFHRHAYMNNRPLFPYPNASTSRPQTPAHPRYQYEFRRHSQAPPMPQDKGCGYYFQAPLKCKDRICHQTVPQHVHHAECEHSLYMNEQWNLAQPSKASIMSQHNTRSTLLAAKEQRFTSFMMLFGFLLRLAFGSGTPSEEKVTPEDTGRPIGEIMKGLFTAIFQLLSNLLRYSISAIWQGIKRVDWDRAWKIMAFVYIAYIWGGKEEKRLDKLGEMVRGRQRVVRDLTGVDGPRYMLVEDMRGWSRSAWDMPGI